MKRREFLVGTTLLLSSLHQASAQQPPAKKRLAFAAAALKLDAMLDDPFARLIMDELKRQGFVEGENLIVDRYSAEGRAERYEALAREVVATNPDAILTGG